mgnify:CR=1 FL=1
MSRPIRTGRRFTKVGLVLSRVTVCFAVTASMLGSPLWVLCVENDGSTGVESVWFLCCAANELGGFQESVPSKQSLRITRALECDPCLDFSLTQQADHQRRNGAQFLFAQLWAGTAGLQADALSRSERVGQTELTAPSGHSGSDLVSLSSVRLLT